MHTKMLFKFPYNLLLVTCLVAFVVRAYNLYFNSIFVDEAFYIVIGQDILAGKLDQVAGAISWVGAFPFIYPFFSGLFYSIGGIVATRLFNVELGTLCVVLLFLFTRSLNLFPTQRQNNIAGLIAGGLLATTAVPIQISRIAIYDMLSFTIFLVALNIFLKAVNTKKKVWYISSAFTIFLAFLAKYVILFYIPFFIVSGWFVPEEKRKNFTFYFSIPLFILTALYFLINLPNLIEYFSSQVGDPTTTYLDVLNVYWLYSSYILLFGICGAIAVWKEKKETIKALVFMGLLPVAVHALTRNNTSSEQHTFLVLVSFMPLAAAFFTFAVSKNKIVGTIAVLAFLIMNLFYSYPFVAEAETLWPNSDKAISVIKENVSGKDIILAEGSDTVFLGLDRRTPIELVIGPFEFSYKNLEGRDAYLKAIEDRYFKVVEIENVYFREEDVAAIEAKLRDGYTKIFDDGKIRVYTRN